MVLPEKIISHVKFQNISNVFEYLQNKRYALIKGEALSVQAYGQVGMRHCGDIDILIPKSEINDLSVFLKNAKMKTSIHTREDYVTMMLYSHQTIPWIKKGSKHIDTVLDINFDIFWGEYNGKRVNIESFLDDTVEISLYGCNVKILPPIKAFIQLVLHHYKEINSIYRIVEHNSINYNMFKDIYFLWNNNKEAITIDGLYALSSDYGIIPYVYYILYYTNVIFGDKELQNYVDAFKTEEGISRIEYYGLTDDEKKKWIIDFRHRLDTKNIYEFIKNQLTKEDLEKIERNKQLFG